MEFRHAFSYFDFPALFAVTFCNSAAPPPKNQGLCFISKTAIYKNGEKKKEDCSIMMDFQIDFGHDFFQRTEIASAG